MTPGGVTLARMSSLLTALQDLVKLEACRLKRFWKLKGTRKQLKPSSYTQPHVSSVRSSYHGKQVGPRHKGLVEPPPIKGSLL